MRRSLRLALLASTLFAMPVKADPIFTPLAFAAFNAGLGVAATNAIIGIGVLGSVFSAVGTLALSVGISYVASLFNRPQQQKPSDGQQEIKQAVPERVWVYGKLKKSGPLAYYGSDGDLCKAVMLSPRPLDAIETIYLDDRAVSLNGSGVNQTDPSDDAVLVERHLGAEDQAASAVLTVGVGNYGPATGWTADHRLRGTAYLAVVCRSVSIEDFQSTFPSGEPSVAAVVRGVEVYDPRNGTAAYSDNAALCILDYLTHHDGYARPIAKIDFPSFIAMANRCDEPVPLAAGGTEKRYRIATIVKLTEARKNVLARLLEACDATLYPTSDGKIAIRGGAWEEPAVTIDADQGHIIESNFAPPDAMSRFNELSIQYLDTALDYVENEGTAWRDEADYASSGQLVTVPLDLVQVPSHSQARRLAKIRMARDNCDWVGEIVTNLYGLNAIGERVIRLKWPELDIDGPYWVEGGAELLPNMTGVKLKLRSANAAAYDWTTAEEGTSTSIPPDTSPDFDLTAPVVTLTQGEGPIIVAAWTPSPALNRTYDVQYRDDLDGPYQAMVVSDFRDSAVSSTVAPGIYHVRIRTNAGPQAVGAWSADYSITIV